MHKMKSEMPNEETKQRVFVAFSSTPTQLYDCLVRTIEIANTMQNQRTFHGWPENDIAGRPLTGPILSGIKDASLVVADVTVLNFNVTFEIGFAIGIKKRAYLIRNEEFNDEGEVISKVGIFDTLGYTTYVDGNSLANVLNSGIDQTPLETNYALDQKAPVYLLETPYRGDAMGHIISRVKRARLRYRSFNPSEEIRMAAMEAIKHVASSHGVIVPVLSAKMRDRDIHNIRAAFISGLAHGMGKPTLILHDGGGDVPLDILDSAKTYRRLEDINEHINNFALDVTQSMQALEPINTPPMGRLAQLKIGDPMAENEFQTLGKYYLRRDEFSRTIRGEVNVVVGRKGAGKTALFSQVRDDLRRDKANIVVDLKPEGYQLVKLKEAILEYLTDGAKAHLVTAFWEYLLLSEVVYKLLEKDRYRYKHDHEIRPHYYKLQNSYRSSPNTKLGDFSERLVELSSFLSQEYAEDFGELTDRRLTSDEVTEILYAGNLKDLQDNVSEYLKYKKSVWILFDNLDKGWSVPSPTTDDILILRCLIDASRKIQRDMQKKMHDFYCVVFIRNDVYQLLMNKSPDFGKEMPVSLDWNEAEMLREMLRLRLVQNGFGSETAFTSIWPILCVSHYKAEETSQYIIDRCLMRPRNLLKIFNHCKGFAVNFDHDLIEPDDIEKGMLSYSNDLLIEASQELENIEPEAKGIIYQFINEDWKFSKDEVVMLFDEFGLPKTKHDEVVSFFLYFGFFGIQIFGNDPIYIFDVGYDMEQIYTRIKKHKDHVEYTLNPAFWPALQVGP